MLRKSPLNLTCRADASPEAKFHLYFNGRLKRTSSSGIFNVTVMSDGVYTCVPFNKIGTGKNVSVNVTAVGELKFSLIFSIAKTRKVTNHKQVEPVIYFYFYFCNVFFMIIPFLSVKLV